MKLHYSLAHAKRVLDKLFKRLGRREDHIEVRAWSNCREQGYCIDDCREPGRWIKIVFAEARSSDEIVVIWGHNEQFCIQTNQPSDELWDEKDNRRYFSDDDDAVAFIVQVLDETAKKRAAEPSRA